jgi:protein ImuB
MLWLALHFRHLPLEMFARGTCSPGPLAVASASAGNALLVACDRKACARGICSGMAVSAAWALASDLRIVVRDEAAEHAALQRIAVWALQFTPAVSLSAPAEVLLEVEGSLRLFGGLIRLHRRIGQALTELGYEVSAAFAPTPLAAQLFARAGLAVRIRHEDALYHELQKLPIRFFGFPSETSAMLDNFGVRTVGECLRLPRDGLARRLGQRLLDEIDRALGRLPDPRPPFIPPPDFKAALPLPAPVEQAEALLFAARRLFAELCGWLAATGKGVQSLLLALGHEDRADTRIGMKLVAASRDLEHLFSVLRERLARVELPAPVIAVELSAGQFQALASHNLSFLPDARDHAEGITRLVERLRARLGEKAVCGLAAFPDHRPERAWRVRKPGSDVTPKDRQTFPPRPLWLLASPRPLKEIASIPHHDGPLSLLAGPERIETGWWDGDAVARDYFVARNPAQSLLWIYRERNAAGGWYLHGIFS